MQFCGAPRATPRGGILSESLLEAKLSVDSVISSLLLSTTAGFAYNSEYSKKLKPTILTASSMHENAQIICNRFVRAFFGSRKSFEFLAGRAGVVVCQTDYEIRTTSYVITDRDGIITCVNPVFTKFTGYSSDEAIGQNLRLLKSGFDGYLEKPIRYNAFLASVAALREGRKK